MAKTAELNTTMLPLAVLVPSKTNPRTSYPKEAMAELTASVKQHGVIEPIIVRRLKGGKWEIVCGSRRVKAAKGAKLPAVPARCMELTDVEVMQLQITENLQREDVTAIEEATGYALLKNNHKLTVDDIAVKVGKSKAYVYAKLRLLDAGKKVRNAMTSGKLPESHALELARLEPAVQDQALKMATDWQGKPVSLRRLKEDVTRVIKEKKTSEVVAAAEKEAGKKLQLVSAAWNSVGISQKLRQRTWYADQWHKVAEGTDGAVAGLYVDGAHLGKRVWVMKGPKPRKGSSNGRAPARRQDSHATRQRKAAEAAKRKSAAGQAIVDEILPKVKLPDVRAMRLIAKSMAIEVWSETLEKLARRRGWLEGGKRGGVAVIPKVNAFIDKASLRDLTRLCVELSLLRPAKFSTYDSNTKPISDIAKSYRVNAAKHFKKVEDEHKAKEKAKKDRAKKKAKKKPAKKAKKKARKK